MRMDMDTRQTGRCSTMACRCRQVLVLVLARVQVRELRRSRRRRRSMRSSRGTARLSLLGPGWGCKCGLLVLLALLLAFPALLEVLVGRWEWEWGGRPHRREG